jgi:YVTN family beta-propeller protein
VSELTQRPAEAASAAARSPRSLPPTLYVSDVAGSTVTPIATATNTPGPPIEVGNVPMAIAITPDGETAYVANSGYGDPSDTVTPIATATNTPGPPIQVGSTPWALAITPDGQTVYVVNSRSGTVTPIATATHTPGPPIQVGEGPRAIGITPDGKTAYVANWKPGTVAERSGQASHR